MPKELVRVLVTKRPVSEKPPKLPNGWPSFEGLQGMRQGEMIAIFSDGAAEPQKFADFGEAEDVEFGVTSMTRDGNGKITFTITITPRTQPG